MALPSASPSAFYKDECRVSGVDVFSDLLPAEGSFRCLSFRGSRQIPPAALLKSYANTLLAARGIDVGDCVGFRMTAPSGAHPRAPGGRRPKAPKGRNRGNGYVCGAERFALFRAQMAEQL
jgi:hypothetical protein